MTLQIIDISVLYRDGDHSIQALEDIYLEIKPGKCLALVGESGSGKTTLGNACMGLLPSNAQKSGEIQINGKRIDHLEESKLNKFRGKNIAMVFQNSGECMNPVHQIMDQVAEPLIQRRLMSRNDAIKTAKKALCKMGLETEYHERYPHQLSGGQIQRAMLTMATILDPQALILDEPTSSLDALSKAIVTDVIQEGKNNHKSILLITHDLEFALSNADFIAVLYLGQIMEILPSREILTKPMHPYTLALTRSYPVMNTSKDLGGIRGDAFYRIVHQHGRGDNGSYRHSHIQIPESVYKDGHAPHTGCLFQNRCTQAIEQCKTEKVTLKPIENHMVRCVRDGIATLLSVKEVSKRYNKTVALNPTDISIRCGELFSLVGETGSGKTTLAMISAGALKPDTGKRQFDGHNMDKLIQNDYISLAKQIGVIYQNPAGSVSHRFTVFDIISEPLKIHKVCANDSQIYKKVKNVLSDVHLSNDDSFLKRYPHELNMGAIQRICIARALILNPSLLIADEPTSALDPSVQAKVLKLLLELQTEKGLSMLFITHDIGLARKISDRIGVMLKGRIVETGPANFIISSPRHPYTLAIIESVTHKYNSPDLTSLNNKENIGCPFASRCKSAQPICRHEMPLLKDIGFSQVACHFPL